MRLDLKYSFNEGMNLLTTWRKRYSNIEYPEKVILNIFYRKYSVEFMWDEINNSFQERSSGDRNVLWDDFKEGFLKLKESYQQVAISNTHPNLINLLSNHSERIVGSISFSDYQNRIIGAKQGNHNDIEEIEFAYIYHRLTDECVFLWSAFGGTGLNKIEAIAKMSGLIIESSEIDTYSKIERIVGRLCAAPYLNKAYNPLPPI
jgi:hypothetical protein